MSGSQTVTPQATGEFTYSITCDGAAGSASVLVANDDASIPTTVSLSLAPPSVIVGQPAMLTWSATKANSCTASGAWSGNQATSGSIAVTQGAAGTFTYNLACTGPGGSASGAVTLGVTSNAANTVPVVIDNGPASIAAIRGVINAPFVDVTLCRPGTTICQTIDHVLLDTGSYGLRIIAPGVLDPALALPAITTPAGNQVAECAQFVSGFLWGSVRRADVKLAGEVAPSLPVQQVETDPAFGIPSSCSNTGANLGTVAALGAKGILGVGLFRQDCGTACTLQAISGAYYECSGSSCASIKMPLSDQVANPVSAFGGNNNGVSITMPAIGAGGATTLMGTLVFGIDTQSNNRTDAATIYMVNSRGNFTTIYNGTALTSSFLDSGSNGLFFFDASIPVCSDNFRGFYCPAAPLALSAVNASADGTTSGTISLTITNPQSLDPFVSAATIGGSTTFSSLLSRSFDWGMPFFYGRTVFVAIEGANTQRGSGPYWAY